MTLNFMHAITAMVYLLFLASRIASKPNVVYQIYLSFEFRISYYVILFTIPFVILKLGCKLWAVKHA